MSRFEARVKFLLEQANITFTQEQTFQDLKSSKGAFLRFDFALWDGEELICLIELNGRQHYERAFTTTKQFALQREHDEQKKRYCAQRRIRLVIVPYTEEHTITLEELLERGGYFS